MHKYADNTSDIHQYQVSVSKNLPAKILLPRAVPQQLQQLNSIELKLVVVSLPFLNFEVFFILTWHEMRLFTEHTPGTRVHPGSGLVGSKYEGP